MHLEHTDCSNLTVQDVLSCLVLAESVYKAQAGNQAEMASIVSALRQDFPASYVPLERLQWSLPHVAHRFVVYLIQVKCAY